jgi:acylphosphatase
MSAVNYKSVGGDMAIEATLTAWAEVTKDTSIEVVVEAPTSEKRATQCGRRARLQADGFGSTGRSSPDAAAPVTGVRSTPANGGAAGASSWLIVSRPKRFRVDLVGPLRSRLVPV